MKPNNNSHLEEYGHSQNPLKHQTEDQLQGHRIGSHSARPSNNKPNIKERKKIRY